MSAHVSLEQIVAGFMPDVPKLAAVLFAYLDESGTQQGATATVLGGLVGRVSDWTDISQRWRERLDIDGAQTFHATKLLGGHGEFHSWRPDKARMRKLYDDLANIAGGYELEVVSGSVLLDDWNRFESEQIKARFPSSYSFAFELCLFHIDKIASLLGERCAVFYATHQEYNGFSAKVAAAYVGNPRYLNTISTIAPANPVAVMPLQVADMCAYETYHRFHSKPQDRPELPLLRHLYQTLSNGFYYDYDALMTLEKNGPSGFLG